jgi:hypothetical protein
VFQVSTLNQTIDSFAPNNTVIKVNGGNSAALDEECKTGASGTLFVQLGHADKHLFNGAVYVSNQAAPSYAVTMLDSIPSSANVLSISDKSCITSKQSVRLLSLSTCNNNKRTSPYCSVISMINSSFVALSNSSDTYTAVGGTVWTMAADEIKIVNSRISGFPESKYSFNFSARNIFMSDNSSVEYSGTLHVNARDSAEIMGDVLQVPGRKGTTFANSYYRHATTSVLAGANASLGNIIASNVIVQASHVSVYEYKRTNSPTGYIPQSCQFNMSRDLFTCDHYKYTGTLQYNNTFVLMGNMSVSIGRGASVEAAQVLVCAPIIQIHKRAQVSSNERGCAPNHGTGAGGAQTVASSVDGSGSKVINTGGGGGGYGGRGGSGYESSGNEGNSYFYNGMLSSGSGGGCATCNYTYYGAGGGIISIVANVSLQLDGNLTCNGALGTTNSGGGSGGAVTINALSMQGLGYITARGGNGGSGKYPGGGGGGGAITIYNDAGYYLSYSYQGVVSALGGNPGHPLLGGGGGALNASSASGGIGGWITQRATQAAAKRTGQRLLANDDADDYYDDDDVAHPNPGEPGVLNLPVCPAGYGNYVASGTLCGLCPVGTYSTGDGSNECKYCHNKPAHSHYTDSGVSSSNCPYECDSGYSTSQCYTPFQNFLFHTLGTIGLVFVSIGLFSVILIPLMYYRFKKEYGWFEEQGKIVLPTDTFARVDEFRSERTMNRRGSRGSSAPGSPGGKRGAAAYEQASYSVDNPLGAGLAVSGAGLAAAGEDPHFHRHSNRSELSDDVSKGAGGISQDTLGTIAANTLQKAFQHMDMTTRLQLRLRDSDLVYHACRINFLGSNHPDESKGTYVVIAFTTYFLCQP